MDVKQLNAIKVSVMHLNSQNPIGWTVWFEGVRSLAGSRLWFWWRSVRMPRPILHSSTNLTGVFVQQLELFDNNEGVFFTCSH